jgi:aspartyl aminopeptidase
VTADLLNYLEDSPTPYHAAAEATRRLAAAGFKALDETASWAQLAPGGYYVTSSETNVIAFVLPEAAARTSFQIIGAHTDSPNLRLKPHAEYVAEGYAQLGIEVYGGVLLNSWLDRDLGIAGRLLVRDGAAIASKLVSIAKPLLRVPQLAIHLDREVNDKGLMLDKQRHLTPVWALGPGEPGGLEAFVAGELEVARDDVLAWDLMLHDVQGSRLLGREQELIAAPRLDNLASCHAGLTAFLAALEQGNEGATGAHTPVLCLFDHEEVGSSSRAGAGGPVLEALLDRAVALAGGGTEERYRARADSLCVSADMAHATHPNYPERHEPAHWIEVNGGPVIKLNTNQRYATDAEGEALFQRCCERAGVPVQKYFHRSNLSCGSTIGPITAARLGIRVVDVGGPQLSMHSARELCGSADPAMMTRALTAFYAS